MKWLLRGWGVVLVAVGGAGCAGTGGATRGAAAGSVPAEQPNPAAAHFMSGMIAHHRQAIQMADWALESARGASRAIRLMSERMLVSQADEIATMERWLADRGARAMAHHDTLMPGMLTAEQLARLKRAQGAAFDRLFLTSMIQHHRGAITMVDALLASPGVGQDPFVFQFAADVHADQTAEIERMQRLLDTLPSGG